MRPFALVGFCTLLTLTAAVYFGAALSMVLGSVCLLAFCVLAAMEKTRPFKTVQAALLVSALAFGSFSAQAQAVVLPAQQMDGQDAVLSGTVCELPVSAYGRFYYTIRVDSILPTGDSSVKVPYVEKVRLSTQNALNVDIYGKIEGKAHFYTPRGGEGFDSPSYYAAKGITLFAYLYDYEPVKTAPAEEKPFYYTALSIRRAMTGALYRLLPSTQAGLAAGVLLGDTSGIGEQTKADFQTVGVTHILSVSGLHMATMAQFFLLLLGLLRVPRRPAAAAAIVGVFVFMAVTGFVPSVMRSGIMCLIFLLGTLVGRQADSLNSLGLAAILICVHNPYAAADLGLLLSFSATLGMILCSSPMTKRIQKYYENVPRFRPLLDAVNSAVCTTIAATLFTLPILILSFGTVSLISPIANVLQIVPSTLLMEFAAVAAVLYLVGLAFLAMPLAFLTGLLANYMMDTASVLSVIPYASVSASFGFVQLWLAATLLLGALLLLFPSGSKAARKAAALLSLLLLLVGIFTHQLSMASVTRIAVLQAGDGVSVVLTHGGRGAVIGCGGFTSSTARNYLRAQGIKELEYLQMTGDSRSEYLLASELVRQFQPEHLLLWQDGEGSEFLDKELLRVGQVHTYQTQSQATLWEQVQITQYADGRQSYTGIEVNGVTVLLLSSNCDASLLPPEWQQADVVVAGDIPKQPQALAPFVTILSMSEETAQKSRKRLEPTGLVSVATGDSGHILIDTRPNGGIVLRREA